MRVLALDIGKKRVGVAVSDPQGRVASPVCVLDARDVADNAAVWQHVLQDWEPELLLAGLPRTLSGEEGSQARHVRQLATRIAQLAQLPIHFADERLSSQEAKRILHEEGLSEQEMRGKVDMIAASLFLQSWLDAHLESESEAQAGVQPSANSASHGIKTTSAKQ